VPLTPTLAVTDVVLPPAIHQQLHQRVGECPAAGGRVVVGSDAGMPGVRFGSSLHGELELLVDNGLSPHEALRAATGEAARVLGSDDVGVLEPGRAADVLAVSGDPLTDIRAIRNAVLVLRDGRIVIDHHRA
jgi:enamidase